MFNNLEKIIKMLYNIYCKKGYEFLMKKIRAVYAKTKESAYLSHLDVLSVFERAFRRAGILLEYSNGFTKRPEIVFASPLPVGIESSGEILEVKLAEDLEISYFIREVNKVLPTSITILCAEYVDEDEKNIMSRVYASVYKIEFVFDDKIFEDRTKKEIEDLKKWYDVQFMDYLNSDKIFVNKKNKDNTVARIDIKPMIKDYMKILTSEFEVTVDTGSKSNLKPFYIMEGFKEYLNINLECTIKRVKILFK